MKTKCISHRVVFPAVPRQVYDALMNAESHSQFTGSDAAIRDEVGAEFTVYGGYAHGKNLTLAPPTRIVQSWRANEENWPADYFSEITFELAEHPEGTELHFTQEGVPEEYADAVSKGWEELYWQPLQVHFEVD